MKKKRVLFGCLIATMSLVISACDFLPQDFLNGFGKNSSEQTTSSRILPSRPSSSSVHEHTFFEEWSYNSSAHWHDGSCGHSVRSEVGQHTFDSITLREATCTTSGERVDICTVCDYRKTIAIPPIDHNWQEYGRVAPDCYNSGISRVYCTMCGATREEYLPPIGHDFETISYLRPTCSTPGHIVQQCRICGEMNEYDIPTSDHNWDSAYEYHPAYDGTVSYYTNACKNCGAIKIRFNARDGIVTNGGIRSGTAADYGYMKLSSNGNSISYTFNYPYSAIGTLYQHGVFDMNPGSFESYNYQTGANNSLYNFEVSMNSQVVDLSESSRISYGEFFNNGEEINGLSYNGYSLAADCLVGNVSLVPGNNTMTYTRLASYNIWVDYFVLIVQNSSHQHTYKASWDYDETSHWFSCMDPNCPIPNSRFESAPHTYGERYVVRTATCAQEGLEREVCTVCGYQHDIYLPAAEHNYQSVGGFEKINDGVYLEEFTCSSCNQNALRWNALEYDQSLSNDYEVYNGNAVRFRSGTVENDGGVEQRGSHIVYKLYSPVAAQNVGLAFYMSQSAGSSPFLNPSGVQGYIKGSDGNLYPSDKKYGLKVNDVEVYLGDDPYGTVSSSSTQWYNWPVKFDLVAGENTIDIYCLSNSYRGRMYEFQITGLPYITPNHVHAPADHLEYDSNYHYYPCTNNDGTRFNEEPHSYGEYVLDYEATCETYGQQHRTCTVCGYEQYQSLSPYGHSWDNGVVTSSNSHTENGQRVYTCTVCGQQKTEIIPADHNWGEATYKASTREGTVGYNERHCLDDNATQIEISAMDGIFNGSYNIVGNNYVRVGSTGSNVSYTFNYEQQAVGKLYLRATTSSYSSYRTRTVLNTGTTGSNGYNFEITVNDNLVDMSELVGLTFGDVFENGVTDPNLNTSYSPVALCPIGKIELNPGENTIVYQRNGSYNMYMKDIILVVEPSSHVHTGGSTYSYDENCHWQTCSDPNCPNPSVVINREEHNFVQVGNETAGCYSSNSATYACSKCGYQKTYTGFVDHSFANLSFINNSDGYEVQLKTCPVCGKNVRSMYFNQGIVMTGSYSGKMSAGTTMVWKIPVDRVGKVSIYIGSKMSAGNTGQTFDPSLYEMRVNGATTPILMPSGTYDEIGINSSEDRYFEWASYYVTADDVRNGEIEISFTSNVSSYRMIFEGEIRIEY